MCCHKKCIVKCQDSTVCGSGDISSSAHQPEFTVTEAPTLDISDDNDDPEDVGIMILCVTQVMISFIFSFCQPVLNWKLIDRVSVSS